MDKRHTASEPDIIHNGQAVIDVRPAPAGSDHPHEICVARPGDTAAWRVGTGSYADCERVARKLARYPRQALAFAGIA